MLNMLNFFVNYAAAPLVKNKAFTGSMEIGSSVTTFPLHSQGKLTT